MSSIGVIPVLGTILALFVSVWYFQLIKRKPWYLSFMIFESTGDFSKSYPLKGGFTLSYEQNRLILIDSHQKTIWSTIPSQAFVGLGQITSKSAIHYFFGFKVLEPNYRLKSTKQTMTAIVQSSDDSLCIKGYIICEMEKIPYELTLSVKNAANRVEMKIQTQPPSNNSLGLNRLIFEYESPRDERIFGFGQQFPRELDFKGKRVPIIVNEQGLGRGLQPLTWIANTFHDFAGGTEFSTYAPMAHYITSTGRSMFLENYEFTVFDLRRTDRVKMEVAALNIQLQMFRADHPLDLIEKFTEFTGRMKPLPDWFSSGAIVGTQGGRTFVEDLHQKLESADVPVAGYWLQDWVGNRVAPWGTYRTLESSVNRLM